MILSTSSRSRDWGRDLIQASYDQVARRFIAALQLALPGLSVADAKGAHLQCEAPEHKLAAATRKQMTVRLGMAAALRINRLVDPQGHADFWE